jgi:hypothetical protein
MPQPDIEHRLVEMREYYPSDDHSVLDEALETIKSLREELRRVKYDPDLKDQITELNPAAMFIEGMDEALVGYAVQWGSPPLAVYDAEKIVEVLSKDMSLEEAQEFFEFNIECAYLGPGTPLILHRPEPD